MKSKLSLLVIVLLSSIFFVNCIDIKAKYGDEVMSVHDEIMPLTMKIPPLKEDLGKMKTEMPENAAAIDEVLGKLQEAYDAMYQWMDNSGQVQSELYKLEGEAAMERLEKEKQVILYIQNFTEEAMEEGNAWKEKFGK